MNIEDFVKLRPFLYHLTDRENLGKILTDKRLYSTTSLVDSSSIANKVEFLRTRRTNHTTILINDNPVKIRDQRPISILALSKCLTNGWSASDFIRHLNDRVFFWPTINRLKTHYQRYHAEEPIILRVQTSELFKKNPLPKFCRLNSGATRANSYLGGVAPTRGAESFLPADQFQHTSGKVVEVTFETFCELTPIMWLGNSPEGDWNKLVL